MKSKIAIFRYLVLIFILFLWCSSGFPYEVCKTSGGKDIKWNASYVTYYYNTSGGPSDSGWAIYYGMNTWTNVSSADFTFVYGGTTTSTAYGTNDGYNIVTFGGGLGSGTLAQSTYWYYTSTGYMSDIDIKFNTSYTWGTTGSASVYDVQNVGTHELGHTLCLKDLYSSADSEKTMYYSASAGETKKRTLDNDDISGIAYLYPALPPSCPDLYSWNGDGYLNNGYIYSGSHCPEMESYQERLVTQPVVEQNYILTFKIKELDDEISHINSVAMYYRNGGSDWKELDLISAVHNKTGDVREALKKKDNNRAYTAPGDEILLIYYVPYGGVENTEFKSISSGYYLWSAETWCQVLDLGPALTVQPGDIATLQARINNMSTYELPADARVYFNIQGPGRYSSVNIFSVSAGLLAPGNPQWYSLNWTVPDDAPAGEYTYSASVYIGEKNITWTGAVQALPTVSENKQEGAKVGSSCAD